MILVPSIDIKDGRVVRLKYGDPNQQTTYTGEPAEIAASFERAGAELIHVVDLDGAFSGAPAARDIIRQIVEAVSVPIEVGGGVRSMEAVEGHLRLGVKRVVIGTAAIEKPELLSQTVALFGEAIIGGIDARDGRVAIRGWVETSALDATELGRRMVDVGVREVVHTDISRDGVQTGPNIEASAALAAATGLSIIISGGVSCLDDIRAACEAARAQPLLRGIISGRALYEGNLKVAEAVELTKAC